MLKYYYILLFIAILFLGCARNIKTNIKETDFKTVENCKFLGTVSGFSGSLWGGFMASKGSIRTKNVALSQAIKLNATHIVWTNIVGGQHPYSIGKAYCCK